MNAELHQPERNFSGMFRGLVMDNSDPSKLGRIRVRVYGVFDDNIPTAKLPWAVPAQPLLSGSGSGYGHFAVPEVGSQVWVFFEAQDHNQPVYWAEASTGVHGLPSERVTNYPNRRVMKTKSGLGVYIDDSSKVIRLIHPSGKYIQMDAGGNIVVSASNVTIAGNDITVTGNDITISGDRIDLNP